MSSIGDVSGSVRFSTNDKNHYHEAADEDCVSSSSSAELERPGGRQLLLKEVEDQKFDAPRESENDYVESEGAIALSSPSGARYQPHKHDQMKKTDLNPPQVLDSSFATPDLPDEIEYVCSIGHSIAANIGKKPAGGPLLSPGRVRNTVIEKPD